jgi:acetyltransferase
MRAVEGMMQLAGRLRPQARIDGVTLHPMVRRPHGRELIAGLAEDPTFGPVVLFGQGGKAVEVTRDRAIGLPPLNMTLAQDMIRRTRVSRLLGAYRDTPAADREAIAAVLVNLAQLAADIPEIKSLDLNPLLADENGVIALDARIEIAPAQPLTRYGANPRFAIAPYPKALEQHVTLRSGDKVFLRPVRPEDENLYPALFAKVSAEDLRLRFFAPIREFSHQFIAQLTQIDYARAYAVAAIDEASGDIAGVVRLMHDPDDISGEYAILVRSDWKGRGLGWLMMHLVIDYAKATGLKYIEAQVLPENKPMLDMCSDLGFSIANDPEDQAIRYVRLDLEKMQDRDSTSKRFS